MRTINVCIAHNHNAPISELYHHKGVAHTYPYSGDEFLHLFIGKHLRRHHLHDRTNLGVVQLGFCLSLELWIGDLHADHSRQSLPHVVTGEVAVLLLEQVHLTSIVVERAGECAAETCDMHAAINGVDAVGKRELRSIPAIVVLHRQFDLYTFQLADRTHWTSL